LRICIFGGTFDPPHLGHLILAENVLEQLKVDKFIFIPSYNPPHKQAKDYTSFFHRCEMVSIATKNNDKFDFSKIEEKRKGKSYSIETINEIKSEYNLSSDQLYFMIGGDSLLNLHLWKNPENILKSSKVVVVARSDNSFKKVKSEFLKQVLILQTPQIDISSTEIRNRVKNNQSIKYLVSKEIEDYISDNKLYI